MPLPTRLSALFLALLASGAVAADLPVLEQWTGIVREDALRAQLPSGAIRDKATWENTWKLLHVDPVVPVPAVDFDKEIVLVSTVSGPNRGIVGKLDLDGTGNVNVVVGATKMGGPGFGYVFLRVSKAGIKSVDGKALDGGPNLIDLRSRGANPDDGEAPDVIKAGPLRIKEQWVGTVPTMALRAAAPAGAEDMFGFITDQATFQKVWTAWNVQGAAPKVDFSTEVILLAFAPGPNRPRVQKADVNGAGDVRLDAPITEMGGPGFGYSLVRVDRAGLRSVAGKALSPVRRAPATAPATAPGANAAQKPGVAFDTYSGYFVNNTFTAADAGTLKVHAEASRTLLAAQDDAGFKKAFGSGFVMNDRSHRLPAGVFEKSLVAAVIRRGNAPFVYTVENIVSEGGTVIVRYTAKQEGGSGAEFASPLIMSFEKAGVKKITFIENGETVGELGVE